MTKKQLTVFGYKEIVKILFFIALLIITALALIPSDKVFTFSAKDKINHLIAYIVLASLALIGFQTKKILMSTIIICFTLLIYGIIIEWIQGFVGREPSIWDVVANMGGIGLGTMIVITSKKNI